MGGNVGSIVGGEEIGDFEGSLVGEGVVVTGFGVGNDTGEVVGEDVGAGVGWGVVGCSVGDGVVAFGDNAMLPRVGSFIFPKH